MYDENITILEDADYTADMFWLNGEESEDSFPFSCDEEMNMVSLDRATSLIQEMRDKFNDMSADANNTIQQLRDAANDATKNIEDFLSAYTQLRAKGN